MESRNQQNASQTSSAGSEIRERILDVASRLFAEKSYDGASVREIASQAQVNIAMISYYFGGKEGLFLECIGRFARGRGEVVNRILTAPQNAEELKVRLKLFFETQMSLFTTDKHLVQIIMRESQSDRGEEFHKKIMGHLKPLFEKVENFFSESIKNQVIRPDCNPQVLATITMAVMSHPCMMEKAVSSVCGQNVTDPEYQKQYIDQVCQVFFMGVLK